MPAHCLSPPPAAVCVDACAAPGNKTTQLAALIGSSSSSSSTSTKRGTILAVDRDRVRLATLQRAATQTDAAPLVVPHCDDFLRLTERVALFGGDSTTTKGGNSTRRLLANNSNNNRSSSNSNNKNNNKHNNKNSNDDGAIDALLRRATHALCDPSCSVATLVDVRMFCFFAFIQILTWFVCSRFTMTLTVTMVLRCVISFSRRWARGMPRHDTTRYDRAAASCRATRRSVSTPTPIARPTSLVCAIS